MNDTSNQRASLDNGNQDQVKSAPKNQLTPSSISLPNRGGVIRGMGDKFAANPVPGPGRSGFGPQLSLSYDSGTGTGPLGLVWNLALPPITRKTDKRLLWFREAEESDALILSGAVNLVTVLVESGGRPAPTLKSA